MRAIRIAALAALIVAVACPAVLAAPAPQPGRGLALVCLDPGHGGDDTGANYNGVQEKIVNLDIALRAKPLIEAMGFRVVMTRTGDQTLSLQQRCDIANNAHADIFVAIHNNAYTTTSEGTETYCYYDSQDGRRLATCIHKEVVKRIKLDDRGVKEAGFYVLKHTNMTSALIEGAFLTNPSDARLLQDPNFRQKIAEGVATGINDYLTGPGAFNEYILVANPDEERAAQVQVTYMDDTGKKDLRTATVPPGARYTIDVNKDEPCTELSATVKSTNGVPVVAERAMYFDYHWAWTGGHDVVGAAAPATKYYFAEGTCRPGFDTYFCLQNPGTVAAKVKLTYMKGDGTTATENVTVAAGSRCTVSPVETLGTYNDAAHDFSTMVESTNGQGIIAERPMYFNYRGIWTGGHDVLGTTSTSSTYYFAEGTCRPGFDPYLCVQNPTSAAARVKITYMKGDGKSVVDEVSVPAHARSTILPREKLGTGNDPAHDFSTKLECTNGLEIIAERPMYFNYNGAWTGGHDVMGLVSPSASYYFAEGTCRPGFDPYFCIQNPGSLPAAVKLTYLKGDGTSAVEERSVPAGSRVTVNPHGVLGTGNDPAHDFSTRIECTNGQQIIAERPMYFNYGGSWTGGHDITGVTAPALTWYFAEGCTK